jgi:hypothetical protein
MRYKHIKKMLSEINPEAILVNDLDEAIIGYTQNNSNVAVYDAELCISILSSNGMSLEEAVEYFEYNILNCYYGENSPIFISL